MASAQLFPATQALITELSNELDEPIVVVFDDYQNITEPPVHTLVEPLVQHPLQGLHLVIVCCEEPSLPIATLRAEGRLTELRAADLAFTADELARFIARETNRTATEQQVADVYATTESWPTGARLRGVEEPKGEADHLPGRGPVADG